jgi:hypothetical protein
MPGLSQSDCPGYSIASDPFTRYVTGTALLSPYSTLHPVYSTRQYSARRLATVICISITRTRLLAFGLRSSCGVGCAE